METPVLNKKQVKNTLSGKKKKTEVIKNTLVKPYCNYWPILSAEDNNLLVKTLNKFLPIVVPIKPVIPYSEIKNIPKEERKKFRQKYLPGSPLEPDISPNKKYLILGINDVTKLLEKQEVGCILVAHEVQPRLLVQHILDQAVLYHIPVLVVKNLKTICKNKCGVGSAVVGVHKLVPTESELGLLQQTVCNIHENYAVNKNHINCNRILDVTTISIPDSEDGKSIMIESDDDLGEEIVNFHLKKSEKTRAFVPEVTQEKEEMTFIELDTDTTQIPEDLETPLAKKRKKQKAGGRYNSLVVKRMKGNKNRNKRKIEKFKKKKS